MHIQFIMKNRIILFFTIIILIIIYLYQQYNLKKMWIKKNLFISPMKKYYCYMNKFIFYIKNNINFAFGHFNDGEISLILGEAPRKGISRGKQECSSLLSNKIELSLKYRHKYYFPGIPCSTCYKRYYLFSRNLVGKIHVPACVFHHTKISHFHPFLSSIEGKKLYWFVDKGKDLSKFNELNYNIDISSKIIVKSKNSFDDYVKIKKTCNFENNSIVMLLCGPLGRILAKEWFIKNKNVTYLCLGSYFDSLLSSNKRSYEDISRHKYCSECFDKNYIIRELYNSNYINQKKTQ